MNDTKYWYGEDTGLYIGDMRPGDREATATEIKKYETIPAKLPEFYIWDDGADAYIPDESKREQLQQLAGSKIDAQALAQLSAGFDFAGKRFPLSGELYSQNMAGASAYAFRQQSGGRNLYTIDGGFCLVTDVAGLVAAGDDIATGICMDAVNRKNALSGKTAAELIQFINNQQ